MSNTFTEGEAFAPQRSLFNALGFTKEEMRKPLVGIVSSYNEIVPGHMNIDKIVEAVKLGVAMAGGTPVVFPAIAVCDGIAMGHVGMKYSLVTRDLIADSTECMALAHQFDALVMVPNCDKNVPGLLMAAARVNVPTVFVSGGPMLAGRVKGCKTSLSSMFEAVGSYAAGKITKEELDEFENKTCPTCGSCSGMYTANSMNCLTEVLGMGLQGNGTIPAVYSERIRLAKHAGMKVMELLEKNIRPRDILTEEAFENALTVDMALGCSTNSMLHLPAIAHEAGVELNLEMANEISKRTPNLCHLAPAGHTYIEELNEAGGVYAVMNELNKKGLLKTDLMTVTGKTIGENIKIRRFQRYEGTVVSYIHGGGRIGVLVKFETSPEVAAKEGFEEYAKNIAMQVAAINPSYLDEASVPADVVEHEKKILTEQVIESGKPANIAEKIVVGRLGKFFKEVCLVDQAYVKDGDLSVQQYTANTAKELGGDIKIVAFVRFEKGEGLEKREDNFADEVANMIK